MSELRRETRKYLTPSANVFWKWADGGEVIVHNDGTTIMFRQELAEILSHLAPQGLPPLDLILILIAGIRDSRQIPDLLDEQIDGIASLFNGTDTSDTKTLQDGVLKTGLRNIQQLPSGLRASTDGKALIAESVFDFCPGRTTLKVAEAVVHAISSGLEEVIFAPEPVGIEVKLSQRFTLTDVKGFLYGLANLDAEKLKLRQTTGLDELPLPEPLEIPFAEQVRQLIYDLQEDKEHSGLAKLARNLLAAVSLPRPVSEPDDLTHGGVSDICNRGPLDRLLLSELANDDLTLTVRIAVNEALYLRREASPHPPERCRTLLIDCGIRTWGIPRVYLAAVALALAASTDPQTDFQAYRAFQSQLETVDLGTREGLEELLMSLDRHLHPGFAIPEFLETLGQLEIDPEPVLLITEDVWLDREFQAVLNVNDFDVLHIATVKRDGHFQLIKKSQRGNKTLCELELDLACLFADAQAVTTSLLKQDETEDLPAILGNHPFPLRLAYSFSQGKRVTWWVPGYGQVGISDSGMLLYWTNSHFGARLLAHDIPQVSGKTICWKTGIPEQGRISLVAGNLQKSELRIVHIDLEQERVSHTPIELTEMEVTAVCAYRGFLFLINEQFHSIIAVDLETGERAGSTHYPSNLILVCDRFFRHINHSQWLALSFDVTKGQPILTDFPLGTVAPRDVVSIFERDPDIGPVCVLNIHGKLYFPARDEFKTIPLLETLVLDSISSDNISTDGQIVAIKLNDHFNRGWCVLNLYSMQAELNNDLANTKQWIDQPAHWKKFNLNVRKKFVGILVTMSGELVLKSTKQKTIRIKYSEYQKKLILQTINLPASEQRELKTFKPVKSSKNFGCQLSVATWDDGSQAFLDSRGMLHLKSANRNIPEASLCLAEYSVSGWCNDGRFWGDPYFCGDNECSSPGAIFESVIQKFGEHLI